MYGVILSVALGSCRADFDDETKLNVAKGELNLIGSVTIVNCTVNGETIDAEKMKKMR